MSWRGGDKHEKNRGRGKTKSHKGKGEFYMVSQDCRPR